jgi:hypothetical protein
MPEARSQTVQRIVVLGYVLALGMPPIGFAIGALLAVGPAKVRSRHGLWIILVSIIAAGAWALIISTGGLSTTDQNY